MGGTLSMRKSALRILLPLLVAALLAPLFPAPAMAGTPEFVNLYDACDYLRVCMDQRMTEMELFLTADSCPRWTDEQLKEALEDTLSYCSHHLVRVTRYADRSADVKISAIYCDAVRMADAYFSGDASGLAAEEAECLAMAVEIAARLKAQYGGGLELELAIYDTICANMSYQTAPVGSDAFSRLTTVCSAMKDHVGNCQAYSRMFYLLGTLAGLKVGFLSGWYADQETGQHIWNTIELDGQLLMVDVTDGDIDSAAADGPQVYYRCFNIGWDRVPESGWNWWPPACTDRVSNTTVPSLSYYNNQPGFGGCFYSLSDAADACIQQAFAGYMQYQFWLPNQVASDTEMHQALRDAANRWNHAASWRVWWWNAENGTTFHVQFDSF